MKKLMNILLAAVFAVGLTGCYTVDEDADIIDTRARISISPSEILFDADGCTSDGQAYGEYIVTVNPIEKMYYDWTAELIDADWATLDRYTVDYAGVITENAVRITCTANTNWRRSGTLRITLDKTGESADFSVVQTGLKEDATLELSVESIVLMALNPDVTTVTYETNMGKSTVAASVEYTIGEADWLSYTLDTDACTLEITAEENLSPTDERMAVITVSAGSEDTSYIEKEITVYQYPNEVYLFIYGSGMPRYATSAVAAQMTKSDAIFNFSQYCKTGSLILSTSTSENVYPRYAIDGDGTIVELADADAEANAPVIDFDISGVRSIRVSVEFTDDNTGIVAANSSATISRVSTTNCLPDSGVDDYDTLEYVTRDGGTKIWMAVDLHWNGGDDLVGNYKLGSGQVAGIQTGGYGNTGATILTSRNSAYDTKENGGELDEVMMPDGVTTRASVYGRLYSTYEALTGNPSGALSEAYLLSFPLGEPGDVIMDEIGAEVTLESFMLADITGYAASAAGDAQAEADHPSLCMQLQGICPYGWHIANMQDWRDLIYAVSQESSDYSVAETSAYYSSMGGGSCSNLTPNLRHTDWNTEGYNSTSSNFSNIAESFGFGLYPTGWRLFASGYDYGYNSSTVRTYHMIPMIAEHTDSKKAVWRIYFGTGNNATIANGFDIGNGSGNPIRCVKNYENF